MLRAGNRFIHATWYDGRLSLEEIKAKPKEEIGLLCQVTSIRNGMVYYRGVYRHGDREELGSLAKFPVADADKYVCKLLAELEGKE